MRFSIHCKVVLLLLISTASSFSFRLNHGNLFGIGSKFIQTFLGCFLSKEQRIDGKSISSNARSSSWIVSPPQNASYPNNCGYVLVIASYNILADCYAQKCIRDPHINKWSLRKGALIAEIEDLDADIICLQEVAEWRCLARTNRF